MPELLLKSISKSYGEVQALSNVNLNIQDGEFCAIIGPSGSGKTTLLNIIAGFIQPDFGELMVNGKCCNHVPPRDRNIGMVFQDIGLFSHMTVRKNIAYGLGIAKKSKYEIRKLVDEISERMKITELLDKKPGLISGGEAQRVAISRTLVSKPSLYLFDEPLGNLDANLRTEMLTEIKRLHHLLKKTFIFITHDQEQALSAASRVIVMKDGVVQQDGTPGEIYKNPNSLFVAEFFGISTMNMINGELTPEDGGATFRGSGLTVKLKGYSRHGKTKVSLGIRPKDVFLGSKDAAEGIGTISAIEYLGDKNQVYIGVEQQTKPIIAVTAPTDKLVLDENIGINFNKAGILLFDREQGGRLEH